MATLLDNPTFAAQLTPLVAALAENASSAAAQQTFQSAVTALLNEWASTSALAAQVLAQNALVQQLLTQFNAIGVRGSVPTVAALPSSNARAGDAYFCQADYHLYAFIGGNWVDLGLAGTTPDLVGISAAGAAALNQRILEQQWFQEG